MRFTNIAGVVLGPEVAYAQTSAETTALQTLETPFEGSGSAADWAGSITVTLAILILVAVIFSALARRRLTPTIVGSLSFVGLCVLPLLMMALGGFATFEGAKTVEFCHSCHTAMDLYVSDMRNRESTTLAAVHNNNRYFQEAQCYHCHSDYGVWGTAKAKARGLQHLYYWVTNSATARGEKQIQYYGSFPNELCLHCHAGSQRFLRAEDGVHTDMADNLVGSAKEAVGFRRDVASATTSCLDCHGPAHPALADKKKTEKNAK
jgi:nitrate/TMAO reductase-like tetraheme cytochrome c subunit